MTVVKEVEQILVVEDDADIREITLLVLESMGYSAASAANGLEALNRLRTMPALPRLVLLDLMMPVMNGWEFLTEVANDSTFSGLRVVVMSAVADEAKPFPNVADCLRKPVSYDQLAAVVARNC